MISDPIENSPPAARKPDRQSRSARPSVRVAL